MNNKFTQWIAIAVIAVVAVSAFLYARPLKSVGPSSFGATSAGNLLIENYIPYVLYNGGINTAKDLNVTGGVTFGSSGTTFNKIIEGSCALIVPSGAGASIAASTTAPFDCAVTGVVSTDIVEGAQFSTTTLITAFSSSSFVVTYAGASTTAGFITFDVTNNTGATNQVSRSGIASSTVFEIIK